ncbi:hypothetical protein UT300003_32170 [Clostridium sardiniense]
MKNENKELEAYKQCEECDLIMPADYMIKDGLEYYCSDECLHKNYIREVL